jgi:hypothetical protein
VQTFLELGFCTTIMHINLISNIQKIIETSTGAYVGHLETIMKYSFKIVASDMQMGMHHAPTRRYSISERTIYDYETLRSNQVLSMISVLNSLCFFLNLVRRDYSILHCILAKNKTLYIISSYFAYFIKSRDDLEPGRMMVFS